MSSPSDRLRSCDSHRKKKYNRRRIMLPDHCGLVQRGPAVPVYEDIGNHENEGHHNNSAERGQAGDCHIVRRCAKPQRREYASELDQSPGFHCGICKESANEPTTSTCGHIFCRKCIEDHLRSSCPICSSSFENKILLKVPCQGQGMKLEENTARRSGPEIPAGQSIAKLLIDKSAEYLSKVKEFMNPENLKEKASSLLKIKYVIIFLLLSAVVLSLTLYGFLPKLRLWDLLWDLKDFIGNYNLVEPATPLHPNPDHITITEDKLPGTTAYIVTPGENIPDSGDSGSKSIFKLFLVFLGLVD